MNQHDQNKCRKENEKEKEVSHFNVVCLSETSLVSSTMI